MDSEGKNVVIGDQKGSVYFLDRVNLEKQQVNRKIRCGGSSIQDLTLHSQKDYLAVVSLDRYLR